MTSKSSEIIRYIGKRREFSRHKINWNLQHCLKRLKFCKSIEISNFVLTFRYLSLMVLHNRYFNFTLNLGQKIYAYILKT